MSGHSKWATTKRRKDAVDSKRANAFTKLSHNISIAAKRGGDPEMNFSLFTAIEKAKSVNMPKDNIEKAVKRGTGELGGAIIEEVLYEGFGPGGIAILVEGVTDNKNRTTPEVRAILSKYGGSLGAQNSVKWMFEHKGVIHLQGDQIKDKDELILELIDSGADDVMEEDGGLTIYSGFANFEKIKKQLEQKSLKLAYAEMEWVAKEKQSASDEISEKIQNIVEILEEQDDINSVYVNVD